MKDPDLRQFGKRTKLKKPNSLEITLIIPEIRSGKRRKKKKKSATSINGERKKQTS